jgi:tetratricopeptide (TPR) repeat protein
MIAVTTRSTFGAQVALACHDELSREAEGPDNPELLARCACILYAASPSLPWETAKNRRTIDGYLRRCDGKPALPWEYTFAAACRECSHLHNWKRAGELFEAAALGSNGESVQYWWHPALLASKGQFNEAIDLLKAAIDNSGTTTSIGLRCDLGLIQLMAGRRDDAWATFDEITLFTPEVDNAVLLVMFLILYEATDEIGEACAMLEVFQRRAGDGSAMYRSFASFYGYPDEDEETHSPAVREYGSHMHCWLLGMASLLAEPMGDEDIAFRGTLLDISGFNTALARIALREYDKAVACLERAAFEEEDPYSMWFHLLPPLRHLQHRDDFRRLLKRLNLPDYRWR